MKFSRLTTTLTILLLLSLALTACNVTPTADSGMSGDMGMGDMVDAMADLDAMLTGDVLRVEQIRSRPAPLAGGTGAAYMYVVNPTDTADQLMAVSSPVAKVGEIHETVNDDGVMRMVPQPDGFEIPPMSVLELKPGGKHIMLIDLDAPLEVGDEYELTLTFREAGEMTFTVPVVEMNMPMMNMPMEGGN